MGIWLARGAIQKNIFKMVLLEGPAVVATGLAIVPVAHLWLTRLISAKSGAFGKEAFGRA